MDTELPRAITGLRARAPAPPLFWRWQAAPHPSALAVVIHGFGEHCGRYGEVGAALAAAGIGTLAFDLRGHGHSGGRRTFIRRFADYLDDVAAAIAEARQHQPTLPLFLLGHSLGGLLALAFALDRPHGLRGLVLVSPALRFAAAVPRWKHTLATAAARLWPWLRLPAGIDADRLTHDLTITQAVKLDDKINYSATARWYTECLAAQQRTAERAASCRLPVLVLAAGEDALVDLATTRAVFAELGSHDKQLVVYDGWWHEVLQEVGRAGAFAAIIAWVSAKAC